MSRRSSTKASYIKRTHGGGKPKANGRAPLPDRAPGMNKTEARYAETLDAKLASGQIVWFRFEFLSIKLADNTHYKPDFIVQCADGSLEIHEVKAARGGEYMTTPEAWVKLKVAAKELPLKLYVVWETKDKHWHSEALN